MPYPRSTPRQHRHEYVGCPIAGGAPTPGEHCLRFCEYAVEQGESELWFSCKLLAPKPQARREPNSSRPARLRLPPGSLVLR